MRDAQDFETYVRADATALLRTAVLLTRNRADAEDLLQSCLLRVGGAWRQAQASPHRYSRRVLANLAVDGWRQRARRPPAVALVPDVAAPGDDMARMDLYRTLVDGLRALPGQQRAALVLRYWEDMTEADTAAVLGCSIGTVKSHTARGLARLRALTVNAAAEGST
jgi:RNA polymerase sigma-70 factor (sigma-E family)